MARDNLDMVAEVLRYTEPGFYRSMADRIEDPVRAYAEARTDGTSEENLATIKHEAQQSVESVVAEGLVDPDDPTYVNLDAEFFTDSGALDEEKLGRFVKDQISMIAYQQMQWTFAGTSGSFTQITEREMELRGQSLERMLPAKMIAARRQAKRDAERETIPPNTVRLYLHPDGRILNEPTDEDTRIRFDRTADRSGFDWGKTYDINEDIPKDGWTGAFDKDGMWTKVATTTDPETQRVVIDTGPKRVAVLEYAGEAYLVDEEAILVAEATETYYDVQGRVYGTSAVDAAATVVSIKADLAKRGITRLAGVRMGNAHAKETYKTLLADIVDEKTRYIGGARNVAAELAQRAEHDGEVAAAHEVAATVSALAARELPAEVIVEALAEGGRDEITMPVVAVGGDDATLEAFLTSPEVWGTIEPEAAAYLRKTTLPTDTAPETKGRWSRVAQNIVSEPATSRTQEYTQTAMLKAAYAVVVQGKPQAAVGKRVVYRQTVEEIARGVKPTP
ncbi:MAG: hypothetical protein MI724_14755, partial [Spirochaetales bacterium]|nr:hypothetical protein [Spirochaetales bacterium]